MKTTNKIYTLTKTTLKNGKYLYVVTDNEGNVISERKSNREYVACTIHGTMFFGRLDLIGKGDHGRYIRDWNNTLNMSFEQMNEDCYCNELTIERFNEIKKERAEWLEAIQTIAYLKNN